MHCTSSTVLRKHTSNFSIWTLWRLFNHFQWISLRFSTSPYFFRSKFSFHRELSSLCAHKMRMKWNRNCPSFCIKKNGDTFNIVIIKLTPLREHKHLRMTSKYIASDTTFNFIVQTELMIDFFPHCAATFRLISLGVE